MPVAVVDVGSNTVRLLVTQGGRPVLTKRLMLHLGADVEATGSISPEKLDLAAEVVGSFVAEARAARSSRTEVLITSPGRQAANAQALVERLAASAPVRVLSAAEEGRLAFLGALQAAAPPVRRSVAVVDVGGGSAQVIVGSIRDGVRWSRSIDIGSQRLTSRLFASDPPGSGALAAARAEVEGYLDEIDPPAVRSAYAVGGSARALKRLAGNPLDAPTLEGALALLAHTPSESVAQEHGIAAERARTLPAGAAILAGIQRRLGAPLKVVRGGVREGALSELEADRAVA